MSKSISIQAGNKINLAGKLMDVQFGDGKLSDGRPYQFSHTYDECHEYTRTGGHA